MKKDREFRLVETHQAAFFLTEQEAWEGVKRTAGKVAEDVKRVTGIEPEQAASADEIRKLGKRSQTGPCRFVLFCTVGRSPLLEELIKEGKFDITGFAGKREVYRIQLVEHPFAGEDEALVVCGSDKRGTIYGMYSLSEYIGVSPLYWWGDAEPLRRESLTVGADIEVTSAEPGVKYRGFFINDEWPCFGNWTFSHFGGFTARMYEHVFELLLRLKGNYLWPAMWTSSFAVDGPGSLNEELADIYGVIIGYSHHEPCLRSSEEWDKVRGENSPYGNEWNFCTNRKGMISYWRDALIRSGRYENLITIGMRGERDSSMLGQGASLAENIELLKDVITVQRGLIDEYAGGKRKDIPLVLALYKEVEAYFYGDESVPGLKDWDGLDGVICMLCEDNFGHMRTLPTGELKERAGAGKGGFGMYYHFDYHGEPVSYEWLPSTPWPRVWEQMTMAWDYGVRDAWIVNVGDLKGNEASLAYFLKLAYDFETWGTKAPGSWVTYTATWLKEIFPLADGALRAQMGEVLTQYTAVNSMRRPEALHAGVYHPCHYSETDRMLLLAGQIDCMNEAVYEKLGEIEKNAYYSMIYYPAKASMNLLRMHLYAGKNAHYARQGKTIANFWADMAAGCIEQDRRLAREFAAFRNGKWKGMELGQHIGFVKWNEDNCRYPLRMLVEPAYKPRMTVSRRDSEEVAAKNYGYPSVIMADDFLYAGNEEVVLEVANDGIGEITYSVELEKEAGTGKAPFCPWLTVIPAGGTVSLQEEIVLRCDRSLLPEQKQTVTLLIRDGETTVSVVAEGQAVRTDGLPPMTFLENASGIVMEAEHYAVRKDSARGGFHRLAGYGRSGSGMKVFPSTESFSVEEFFRGDAPSLTCRFLINRAGNYAVELWTEPTNPVCIGQSMRVGLKGPAGEMQVLEILSPDFKAGEPYCEAWAAGVLNQNRITKAKLQFEEGIQTVELCALEAGLVLERIIIHPVETELKDSYLGPEESYFVR